MMRTMHARGCLLVAVIVMGLLGAGCAGRYFKDAGAPPVPPPRYEPGGLPYQEYWTGIVFNGNKIGFSHFSITASKEVPDHFEVRSETLMHFKFLMMDKKISLVSYDLIGRDLTLKRLAYGYDIDGSTLKLSAQVRDGVLEITRDSGNQTSRESIPLEGAVYPGSILYLYPVVHGLEIGRTYRYQVYDSETQGIEPVVQEIQAYQESDLFAGKAFRMQTDFLGQEMTSWIDEAGRPLFEQALGGVLLSGLESETEARRYLLESAMNREDTFVDFSLIRTDTPIDQPRQTVLLEVLIGGIGDELIIPSDERQACEPRGPQTLCRIDVQAPGAGNGANAAGPEELGKYLQASYAVPCTNDEVVRTAHEITRGASTRLECVDALLTWIGENIEPAPVDVFTALDVLEKKKAECQGHAYLYAALARAVGIPTRVVGGIVYADEFKGFLYHAWAESHVDGKWTAVDPTTGQVPADATHIKFIEGEGMSSLIPLVGVIGKVSIEVVRAE